MTRTTSFLAIIVCLLLAGSTCAALAQETAIDSGTTAPLACGWNMVGFPVDEPTAIAACQVRDPDGTVLPVAQAAAAEWLQLPAYSYDGSGYRSCGVDPWDDSAFRPWTGYWIYVRRCGIQVIYPIPIRVPCGSGILLKTDRPIYDLCPMCTVIPPPIRMCLVVFNTTCVPVTYTFMSGQEFDFEIYNAEGKLIWRWSDDKAFPLAVHRVTLCACCTNASDMACRMCIVGYAEFVPIDPETQMVLPAGLYLLRGWLTADKTMEARITFEIRYGGIDPKT